ncbi:unnamed protein product [Rotaria magnacalcarata]
MAGMMGATVFLSMWMNNTTSTSIMLPVTLAVVHELGIYSENSLNRQQAAVINGKISTELADAEFHVTIVYHSGQYFMRQQDWTPYLSNQTIEKSLEFWKYWMEDENFNEKFSEKIYHINHEINWDIPSLKPASFIVLHKKTFIDDDHFFELTQQKVIEIKGSVREIVGEGVIFDQNQMLKNDANQYLSNHRYLHLPSEKSRLPITDGRCNSATKKNLYFPGFDYGINQRVDFALYLWYIGERILSDIMGSNFTPELSPSKIK